MKRLIPILLLLALAACGKHTNNRTSVAVAEGVVVRAASVNGGSLTRMLVNEGDSVSAGRVVAVIDTTSLHLQLNETATRLQETAVQRRLQSTRIEQAQAELDWLRQKEERTAALVQGEAASQQALDDIRLRREQAEKSLAAARQQMDLLAAQEARISAGLELLRQRIRDSIVRAPESGIVTTLYYRQGETVPPLGALVEITRVDEMEATIYLPAQALPGIQVGQPVQVTGEGMTQPLPGSIEWISPRAEFTPNQILTEETRSSLVYAVRVCIPNPRGLLKHGMPVQIERQGA